MTATRKPEFITFTGLDFLTDVTEMLRLSTFYPIEWGVLFSPNRQGAPSHPRYPDRFTRRLIKRPDLRLSAHLCGGHSLDVMRGRRPRVELDGFTRVQVNATAPGQFAIESLQHEVGLPCIAQCRGSTFPAYTAISWLYDASGGRGIRATSWPAHPGGERLVGYAGGIGPDNVLAVLDEIAAASAPNGLGPYWIDMESGVRTDDHFDLAKCRRVCELVYGVRP